MNDKKTNKKVIVTGCTGQDGSYMCEYLLENTDYTVLGGIRRTSQAIMGNLKNCVGNPRFKLVPLELTDSHSITTLIKNEKPDYFINFGASSFVADSWNQPHFTMEANATSLIHILEAIRHYSPECKFYSAGSSEQWGDVKYSPQDEKHPFSPRSVYGVSKCCASLLCKVYRESYNIIAIHGILTNHESPRRQLHFVTRKVTSGVANISAAIKNNSSFNPILLGNVNSKRDWSHSKDFIDGIWRMLNQDKYRKNFDKNIATNWNNYVLSSTETHSIRELVETAFSCVNISGNWSGNDTDEEFITSDGKVLVSIDPKFYRPADVNLLLGDSTLARKELGWAPTYDFKKLISEMVQYDVSQL